ncbi:MAG: hypothetical protein LBV21_05550 [Candidatus Adiutrix sp.]|jgi:hypothetical protein|nr:hypothetical protein [Candidatus Adiutrix sp.]
MAEPQTYAYAAVEVGGIQNYIFATGKLKEVIGASQIIELVTAEETWAPLLKNLGLELLEAVPPSGGDRWAFKLQAQAGSLALLLPGADWGRRFLKDYARLILGRWPGLPVDGALVEHVALSEVINRQADSQIACQRAQRPPDGLPLNPFVEMAPLDGRAAVKRDRSKKDGKKTGPWLSRPSLVRRDDCWLKKAKERLTAEFEDELKKVLDGRQVEWSDDLEELLAGREKRRVALIHIDGNDLGHFFSREINKGPAAGENFEGLVRSTRTINELSGLITEANRAAFQRALAAAAQADQAGRRKAEKTSLYRAPFRPLVMGGDDLTALVRADLAFDFLAAFVSEYEKRTQAHELSLGVGMVIMPASYPFLKAYHLAESLCSNAKKTTVGDNPRPSSLDYVIISGEVDNDLDALRRRAVADDGSRLTGKPFKLTSGFLEDFLKKADEVLNCLPRAHTRGALEICRRGRAAAQPAYAKLRDNIRRELGGRHEAALMNVKRFDEIFHDGFFEKPGHDYYQTALADYLELRDYRPGADSEPGED